MAELGKSSEAPETVASFLRTANLVLLERRESLFWKSLRPDPGIPAVVANDPNSDNLLSDVIQKMIRKSFQATATESTLIEMEKSGILDYSPNGNMKLSKEIVSELIRHLLILPQRFVQVLLNFLVKPNVHAA